MKILLTFLVPTVLVADGRGFWVAMDWTRSAMNIYLPFFVYFDSLKINK